MDLFENFDPSDCTSLTAAVKSQDIDKVKVRLICPDSRNLYQLSKRLKSRSIIGSKLRASLGPLNTIVL